MAEKGNGNPLELALAQIEKQFGKGAVMRLDDNVVQKVEAISTGCLTLDIALGIGGIPKGRIIEIYGPESSGKTTVALHIVAEVQKAGGTAAFIDAEHALDPSYAAKLGVHLEDLYISQPDSGDQALAIMEMLIRSGAIDLVVVDSVAALTPQAEIDGEMGDSHVGLQARLMSQALRKITAVTSKTGCSIIFINQLREKVGVVYGSAETTTGGKALKFYASVRIDVRRTESIKDGGDIIGNRVKHRQPRQGEDSQKQGRASLQGGGVRHHVRHGHFLSRLPHRPRRAERSHPEERQLVQLQRREDRAGQRESHRVFARQPRHRGGHRPQDPRKVRAHLS